jgi:hypothetical protein
MPRAGAERQFGEGSRGAAFIPGAVRQGALSGINLTLFFAATSAYTGKPPTVLANSKLKPIRQKRLEWARAIPRSWA